MTTKEQERKALELIRRTIEALGEDSYVGTALEGCLELAERNIEEDAAYSMKQRWESAQADLVKATEEHSKLVANIESLRAKCDVQSEAAEIWRSRYETAHDVATDARVSLNISQKTVEEQIEQIANLEASNKALEQQILELKAKLYDFMVAH